MALNWPLQDLLGITPLVTAGDQTPGHAGKSLTLGQDPNGPPPREDDGGAAHLVARRLPSLTLPSTGGQSIALRDLGRPRSVLYVYPMTGRPGVPSPEGWDLIPGAKGCTAEACAFRDHYAELREAGADVYGLSSQSGDYQQEAVARLHLPFPLISDERLATADTLGLPTFTAGGTRLFTRLTMIVTDGVIDHVFYPVRSPEDHAGEVLSWLQRGASQTRS